jgi:hypothetical protein
MVGLSAFSRPSSRVSISFSNCWRSAARRYAQRPHVTIAAFVKNSLGHTDQSNGQ